MDPNTNKWPIYFMHLCREIHNQTFVFKFPCKFQLENLLGGEEAMVARGQKLVGPCLAQFARCMQDDVLWKQLHYQILLKTRSNHPKVTNGFQSHDRCLIFFFCEGASGDNRGNPSGGRGAPRGFAAVASRGNPLHCRADGG
jgi:hypothetical protein